MKTTLRIGVKREAWTNCSTISPDDKWLLNPMLPVAQNLQPILQPTCNKQTAITIAKTRGWKTNTPYN